ncbi:kinase-like protein [Trametes sanguinea]|nr:kinase-like protein [Trametes sanguinea]
MTSQASFWGRDGQLVELSPCPESFQRWDIRAGEAVNEPIRGLLQDVERVLSVKVARVDLRGLNANVVLDVEYDDGRHDIVRAANTEYNGDGPKIVDTEQRVKREIGILQWLKAHSGIPVPAIRAVFTSGHPEGFTVVVMEKLPGSMVLNSLGAAPYAVKERFVRGLADIQVQLFQMEMPQGVGTAQFEGGRLSLVPRVAIDPFHSASRVFGTLEEYVADLIEKVSSSPPTGGPDDDARSRVLARLDAELPAIYARISKPSHRRSVLHHGDPSPMNVLMDGEGNVTGVIDWEYQAVLPAVLAVEYPQYIRYDGKWDPRFPHKAATVESWWLSSAEDSVRLREVYAEAIKTKDGECWDALVHGERLRQITEWLTIGKGYQAMEAWLDSVSSD